MPFAFMEKCVQTQHQPAKNTVMLNRSLLLTQPKREQQKNSISILIAENSFNYNKCDYIA